LLGAAQHTQNTGIVETITVSEAASWSRDRISGRLLQSDQNWKAPRRWNLAAASGLTLPPSFIQSWVRPGCCGVVDRVVAARIDVNLWNIREAGQPSQDGQVLAKQRKRNSACSDLSARQAEILSIAKRSQAEVRHCRCHVFNHSLHQLTPAERVERTGLHPVPKTPG
jgi:hypothetical protein